MQLKDGMINIRQIATTRMTRKLPVNQVVLGGVFLVMVVLPTSAAEAYFGEKYEPADGRVYHGLGQYIPLLYSDQENWQYVNEYQNGVGETPLIYSVYAGLDPLVASLDTTDFNNIVGQHGHPYLLTVGISYLDSNLAQIDAVGIVNGNYDGQIREIAGRIKSIDAPVFVRPGFEFGSGNSGAHANKGMNATQFKAIWLRIYGIFSQEGVDNAAWVWNTVNPNLFNFMDYYPGDDYVDWWGINYFTASQISAGDNFLNQAAAHGKPVMIPESCPIQNGGTTNAANWTGWFVPYFNKMAANPNIKAFIYISDPWNKPGFWDDWPDSRITGNATILQNYRQEMGDSRYLHMDEYLNPDPECRADLVPPDSVDTADFIQVLTGWSNTADLGNSDISRDEKINSIDTGWVIKEWGRECQ